MSAARDLNFAGGEDLSCFPRLLNFDLYFLFCILRLALCTVTGAVVRVTAFVAFSARGITEFRRY